MYGEDLIATQTQCTDGLRRLLIRDADGFVAHDVSMPTRNPTHSCQMQNVCVATVPICHTSWRVISPGRTLMGKTQMACVECQMHLVCSRAVCRPGALVARQDLHERLDLVGIGLPTRDEAGDTRLQFEVFNAGELKRGPQLIRQ